MLDDKALIGIVVIEPDSPIILIGMDFLRRFNLGLLMVKDRVAIISEEYIKKATKKGLPK